MMNKFFEKQIGEEKIIFTASDLYAVGGNLPININELRYYVGQWRKMIEKSGCQAYMDYDERIEFVMTWGNDDLEYIEELCEAWIGCYSSEERIGTDAYLTYLHIMATVYDIIQIVEG